MASRTDPQALGSHTCPTRQALHARQAGWPQGAIFTPWLLSAKQEE